MELNPFTDTVLPHGVRRATDSGLDSLRDLREVTSVWFEITALLVPGRNDLDGDIAWKVEWIAAALGSAVPPQFTAFHPDFKALDVPLTPGEHPAPGRIALDGGLRFVTRATSIAWTVAPPSGPSADTVGDPARDVGYGAFAVRGSAGDSSG